MNIIDVDQHLSDTEETLISIAGLSRKRLMPKDGWDRSTSGSLKKSTEAYETREEFFSALGIESAAIYPTRCLSHAMISDPVLSDKVLDAYNTYALEQAANSSVTLRPFALGSVRNPTMTASNIQSYKQDGFEGVVMLPHGHAEGLGDRRYHDIYRQCEELGLPIAVHTNSFGALGGQNCSSFEEFHTLTFPFSTIKQFVNLMFTGTFEKFPNLSFMFLESGCSWLPFWLRRMDHEYRLRSDDTLVSSLPSELVANAKVYLSSAPYDANLEEVNSMLGGGVVWGSDFPHWDADKPSSQEQLKATFPASVAEDLLVNNAARCFGLDIAGSAS